MPDTTLSLADEVGAILRARASRQDPQVDFSGWEACSFVEDVKLANGIEFDQGEMTLCRPAEDKALAFATELGLPAPLAIWSFQDGKEVLINPALVDLEGEELIESEDDGEPEASIP
jgi:hypothetical protein